MNCLRCRKAINPGHRMLSVESGVHDINPSSGHGFFSIRDDTVAHATCSPWFEISKNAINNCEDVDECAVCRASIDEGDPMVRLRIGPVGNDGRIIEMNSSFEEQYLHWECAQSYFEEDQGWISEWV